MRKSSLFFVLSIIMCYRSTVDISLVELRGSNLAAGSFEVKEPKGENGRPTELSRAEF